jgi:AraC family transcriptional regulator
VTLNYTIHRKGGDKVFEWRRTIQKMVNIIEIQLYNYFDDEITLSTLARELGYSQHHVTKQFKNLAGLTFRNYLRLRMII